MDMGTFGMTIIAVCAFLCSVHTDLQHYKSMRSEYDGLTLKKYFRKNPFTPIAGVFLIFMIAFFLICESLENKGIHISGIAITIIFVLALVLAFAVYTYLDFTKDNV